MKQYDGIKDEELISRFKNGESEILDYLMEKYKNMVLGRAENDAGKKVSWRWKTKTEKGVTVILELIAESAELGGGKVQQLPTEKAISALNVPYSSFRCVSSISDECNDPPIMSSILC